MAYGSAYSTVKEIDQSVIWTFHELEQLGVALPSFAKK